MEFLPIKTQAERDKMVNDYKSIKNKLQNQFLTEKVGNQKLYTDSLELFKPLMDTTKQKTDELKEEIVKGQNQLEPYLKEFQKYNENLDAFKELPAIEAPKKKKKSDFILNPNKDFNENDIKNLKTLGFPLPSEVVKKI